MRQEYDYRVHMAIERISKIFTNDHNENFKILYGPGVDDIFINHQLIELKFEEALFEEIRRQGFDRIVFYSPHRSVFFFDSQSESLSRPVNPNTRQNEPNSKALDPGPLNDLKLFQPTLSQDNLNNRNGMGDIFAVRMLDTILRDERDLRSAVVILQSETSLRYFEDQRILAGIVGEWTKLPSTNHNQCLFVFSNSNRTSLIEIASQLPVPEMRNAIIQSAEVNSKVTNIFRIDTPRKKELYDLVRRYQQNYTITINPEEIDLLIKRMEAEDQACRFWQAKLLNVDTLDLENSRKAGWFSANIPNLKSVWERLNELTGLEDVKVRVRELVDWIQILQHRREKDDGIVEMPSLHMIFSGNPGTGKTTVSRMFGEILYEIGYLKKGHLIEVRAGDLIADHIGGTALKTNKVIDSAIDGILFIDEAYSLSEDNRGGFGLEAIETLLLRMENDRHRIVVVAAGYPDLMVRFRKSNPGLERRFPEENILFFEDFSPEDLFTILVGMLKAKDLRISDSFLQPLMDLVHEIYLRKDEHFGNAGEIRNLVEGLDRKRASRIADNELHSTEPLKIEDVPNSYRHLLPNKLTNANEILDELDDLIGLTQVKDFLHKLVLRLEYENLRLSTKTNRISRPKIQHMVFRGNPGTGKTTIARMVGRIFQSMGLLRRGHCVEVTRVDLVAGYVGQTAKKTMDKIEEAFDGILFIDEAYSLTSNYQSDFGQEAIDTLVKAMEDHQNRFVVILAGYPLEINKLLTSNPGLISRFPIQLDFPDFTLEELVTILAKKMDLENYQYDDLVLNKAAEHLREELIRNNRFFGNARTVLNLFETIQNQLAKRVVPLARNSNDKSLIELLNTVIADDVPEPAAYTLTGSPENFNKTVVFRNKENFPNELD